MRKPARKLIKSIAKLRSKLRADRGLLSCRLAERYAERLAEGLAERPAERRSARAVPPVEGPIYESVLDHLGAELSAVETELAAAEEAYAAGQDRVAELRHQRDRAIPDVYRGHASIERFWRSQPGLKRWGVVGATPESAADLVGEVHVTLKFLRDFEADAAAGREAPVLTPGVSLDAGAVADDLAGGLPRLEAAMAAL